MSDRAQHYFVPQPSRWMMVGSFALLFLAGGAAMWFNGADLGRYCVLIGFALLAFMMFRWFGDVVAESESGKYGKWEDLSFRWGMSWFIFSEVMFFAAFFGALFYARVMAVPDLGSLASKELLWPDFAA
ncbi:MAG: cytochrome c oxidase subunit 3, partial [Pseudomonadota bacterium]